MIFMFELFGGQVVYRSIVASATNSSLSRTWPFKCASKEDLRARLRKMEASASDHDTEQAPFLLVRVRWIVEWLDLLILFSPGGSSGATAEDGSKCFQSRDGKGHYLMREDVLFILLLGVACWHMLVVLAVLSQHMPLIWTSWRRSFGCNSGRRNNIVLNMRQLRRLLEILCSFQGNVEGLAAWHMFFGHEFFVLFHEQLGATWYDMIKLQSESKLMKVEWQNVASRFRKICVRSCEKLKPIPLRRSKLPRRSLKVCEISFSCEQKVSSCQDKFHFHAVEFDYKYGYYVFSCLNCLEVRWCI